MNQPRKLRPEDLRPSAKPPSEPHESDPLAGLPGAPQDPHAPSEIASIEEAMVPLLAAPAYLQVGAQLLAQRWQLRLASGFSELLAVATMAGPVVLAILASGVLYPPQPLTLEPSAAEITEQAMVGLPSQSLLPVAAIILGWFGFLCIRALLDTYVARSARDLLGQERAPHYGWARHALAFFGLHTLHLALTLAVSFFLAPLITRLVMRAALTPSTGAMIFSVCALFLGLMAMHHARLLSHFIGGWVTWRAEFLAGALSGGFAAPARDYQAWRSLSWRWVIPSSLWVSVGLLVVFAPRTLGASSELTFIQQNLTLAGMAAIWAKLSSWIQVSLIPLVGHQIGEVATTTITERSLRVKRLFRRISNTPSDQAVIPTAPKGFFKESSTQTPPPRFSDVFFVARPQEIAEDGWSFETENTQVTARAPTAGGGGEVSLTFERPAELEALAAATEPSSGTLEPEEPALLAPALCATPGEPLGLERLSDSLSPAVVRTAAGDAEVLFRGVKTTLLTPQNSAPEIKTRDDD